MSEGDGGVTGRPVLLRLATVRLDGTRLAEFAARRRLELALGFGVVTRLALYLANRPLWMDEGSLLGNIRGRPASELFAPFRATQLAPAGFFVVEWLADRVLGESRLALRLFPLACGIGSLVLFVALARLAVRPGAVWVAVALFAVSGDLVYYASELKPYATDVALAVAVPLAGLALLPENGRLSARRAVGLAALGVVGVWLSFPSAFVLAGVGSMLLADALARRDLRRAAVLGGVCLSWAVSFAGAHAVAVRMLGPGGRVGMNAFWGAAFPPWPPGTLRELLWPVRRVLYLFVNPLDFHSPIGPWLSAAPAVLLATVGLVSLWRRDPRVLGALTLPLLLALGASYPRLYPFHARLVLFLAPALLLLIAEGADVALASFRGKNTVRAVVLGSVLLFPTLTAVYRLVEPRSGTDHNIERGDLRPGGPNLDRFPF